MVLIQIDIYIRKKMLYYSVTIIDMNGIVYTTNKENDNKYFLSFNNKITKTKDKNNISAKRKLTQTPG